MARGLGLQVSRFLADVFGLEEDTISEQLAVELGTSVPGAHFFLLRDFLSFGSPAPIQAGLAGILFDEQRKEFERRGEAGLDDIERFYPKGFIGAALRRRARTFRTVAAPTLRGAASAETIPRRLRGIAKLTPRGRGEVVRRRGEVATLTQRGRRRNRRDIAELP